MALLEESETLVSYDYASELVSVYTTRRGVYDNLRKRIGDRNIQFHEGDIENGWRVKASIKFFREPYMVSKIIAK
jgi:hypothetical protein